MHYLPGGTVPVLPSIAKDVHAAPLAAKKNTYVSGKVVFNQGKSSVTKKFTLSKTTEIFDTITKFNKEGYFFSN